ncbi:DUF600 family protein [Macrococcoides canis]|uniref:immunity protein YezG family protein n=1 Tax=Macrococcoides canis TaxID=1855823 RepID=UPI0013E92DF3|nr:immunity protein YezG family protein [Macrococcus canis]QIH76477.1 DUF600 family protein [Macrococcus canis]
MKQLINNKIFKIIEKANDMIPEEWHELYINGDITDGSGGVFFFYNTANDLEKWKYSVTLYKDFLGYSTEMHLKDSLELFELGNDLQQIFRENNQPIWSNVILHVDENMKLTTEFDYADWDYSKYNEYQKMDYFRHEYLKLPLKHVDEAFFEEMKEFKERENSKQN